MSYLGYFAPTYLECIDGWMGDNVIFDGMTEQSKCNHYSIKGGYVLLLIIIGSNEDDITIAYNNTIILGS